MEINYLDAFWNSDKKAKNSPGELLPPCCLQYDKYSIAWISKSDKPNGL